MQHAPSTLRTLATLSLCTLLAACAGRTHTRSTHTLRTTRDTAVRYAGTPDRARTLPNFSLEEPATLGGADLRPVQLATPIILGMAESPNGGEFSGHGSGVFFAREGTSALVITNYHVVDGVVQHAARTAETPTTKVIFAKLNAKGRIARREETYDAVVRAVLPARDLALLEVKNAPQDITPLAFAPQDPPAGNDCYRVGSPGAGIPWMVRGGTISGTYEWPDVVDVRTFLNSTRPVQPPLRVHASVVGTDAGCGPGDSGGALVDDQLRIIGITFAAPATDAIAPVGYAIHPEHVRELLANDAARRAAHATTFPIDLHLGGYSVMDRTAYSGFYHSEVEPGATEDNSPSMLVGTGCSFYWQGERAAGAVYAMPQSEAKYNWFEIVLGSTSSQEEARLTPTGLWGVDGDGEFKFEVGVLKYKNGSAAVALTDATGRVREVRLGNWDLNTVEHAWLSPTPDVWVDKETSSDDTLIDDKDAFAQRFPWFESALRETLGEEELPTIEDTETIPPDESPDSAEPGMTELNPDEASPVRDIHK